MKYLLSLFVMLTGCQNVASTRFTFTDPNGRTVKVEMPKEVTATDLEVIINPENGMATIKAKKWDSRNVETINAQADRETGNIDATSKIMEKVTKAAVEAAIKSTIPIP